MLNAETHIKEENIREIIHLPALSVPLIRDLNFGAL